MFQNLNSWDNKISKQWSSSLNYYETNAGTACNYSVQKMLTSHPVFEPLYVRQ